LKELETSLPHGPDEVAGDYLGEGLREAIRMREEDQRKAREAQQKPEEQKQENPDSYQD
jgi:hypothetical protein